MNTAASVEQHVFREERSIAGDRMEYMRTFRFTGRRPKWIHGYVEGVAHAITLVVTQEAAALIA